MTNIKLKKLLKVVESDYTSSHYVRNDLFIELVIAIGKEIINSEKINSSLSSDWREDQRKESLEDFKRVHAEFCDIIDAYFHRFTSDEIYVINKTLEILKIVEKELE
jgi:hypothetical protein